MKKIKTIYYTKGRYGKRFREIVDTDNDNHICVSCDVVDYTPQIIEVGRK